MTTVFLRIVIVYFVTVFSIRLMGKRQIGQMQMSELVTAFFLSELAAYPVTNQNIPLTYGIIPVVALICIEVLLSFLVTKCAPLKQLLDGAPNLLVCRGVLKQKELSRARLTVEELLEELRLKDCPSLQDADYVLLESSGKISVIQKDRGGLCHLLIADGVLNRRGLKGAGWTKDTLNAVLKKHNLKRKDIFLFTVSDEGELNLIRKESA